MVKSQGANMSDPTEEQALAALVKTGVRSFSLPDFFSLPAEQQKALLEEDLLEAQSRPTTAGDVALDVLGVALKIVGAGSSIEGAIGLVTGVPSLVQQAKTL
jgi:hypothetical protein